MASRKPPKLRILMLHGYTQSGSLFYSKTRALEKHLQRAFPAAKDGRHKGDGGADEAGGGIELVYVTAPIKLHPADLPSFSSGVSLSASRVPATKDNNGTIGATHRAVPSSSSAASALSNDEARLGRGELFAAEDSKEQELDAWAWWRKDDASGLYTHLSTGLDALASILKAQGPFTGVIGFSQGAAAAAMLASLLEPGREAAFAKRAAQGEGMPFPASFCRSRSDGADKEHATVDDDDEKTVIHPPLRFAVCYSGFVAPHPAYAAFYEPAIRTPVLHFIGSLDTVVDEGRSLKLVKACAGGGLDGEEGIQKTRVVYHPGGHFLPTQRQHLNVLVGFIKETLAEG